MLPDRGEALRAQATALHRAGRLDDAAAAYAQVLSRHPEDAQALTPLGAIALQRGDAEQAVAMLERSLAAVPGQPLALAMLGVALQRLGRLDAALASFDRALALDPGHAQTWNNRGVVLRRSARLDEALASYDRALALDAGFAEAHNNRGNVLQDLRRLDAARASFDRAIALRPQYAEAWWNKARLALLLGEYEEGWRLAEWRWQGPQRRDRRSIAQPLWLGDAPVAGRTILVHAEQGLGDTIQCCRYAPRLEALGAKVVLEVPQPLVALLATLSATITVVEQGRPLPAFDLHCPVMSLPRAFRTTLATVPATVPYLHADPGLRAAWRARLGARTLPRIGLAWSGSPHQAEDSRRSMPLAALAPILALPFEFHVLQKDIRADDAAVLAASPRLRAHADELTDFAATAALAAEMDLVISVCTSVAHLAGALGRPLWVLLSFMPDYRWLLDRPDSPWYPTAALLRQASFGDWGGVVEEARRRLQGLAATGGTVTGGATKSLERTGAG